MNRRKTLKLLGAAGVAAVFGVAAIPEPSFAQDQKKMVTVVKIAGIPWFNALENGVKKAARISASMPRQPARPHLDPAQQVKLLEDLFAKLVLSGTQIVDVVEIPGLGKAIVDVDDKQSKVEKTMIVNKDTIDGLIKQGL